MSKLHDLLQHGQSIWLDYIRRNMLVTDELQQLREEGVRGVTSNPAIFEKAIAGSDDYDDDLALLAAADKSAQEIYEALAVEDIRWAADVMRPVYEQSDGGDGMVSLEVDPNLAHDTNATIAEARRLFAEVDRPNVYIKVPATPEGIPAIETLIGEGINVNVTLLFSRDAYEDAAHAYIAGLERLAENGGDLRTTFSVASFFISRVDVKVDEMLAGKDAADLQGTIGIANAKLAYQRFKEIFSGERWDALAEQGAQVQRPLWASTSTKNPDYSDTLYVDNMIGPDTVNTIPPQTLEAFLDHGTVAETLEADLDEARAHLERLADLGIDIDQVTDELLAEGVEKFAKPFNSLLDTIGNKCKELLHEDTGWEVQLGDAESAVDETMAALADDDVVQRIWERDHTVWQEDPEEISNRLGWLDVAERMKDALPRLEALVHGVQADGYTHALLLGMGGSSLAPELFARTFGTAEGHLQLGVLDSTDPGAVSAYRQQLDPATTLFIVASKSGTTVETMSFFKYFYDWTVNGVGADTAGEHFIAITDPGSKLVDLAEMHDFRAVFENDPHIGGRYSALSYFGLVPAGLLGIDLKELLQRATLAAHRCKPGRDDNRAALLGGFMGAMAATGRDKLTLITSDEIAAFADWAEQLIAESTGKNGTGILPVVGEPLAAPDAYDDDRFFVYLRLDGGTDYDDKVQALADAGVPTVGIHLQDRYDVGAQFFIWEMATAIAGHVMGIHPFNQPNVEAAKVRAKEMVAAYREEGSLPDETLALTWHGITVYPSSIQANDPAGALDAFLGQVRKGDYIGIHAYVEPNEATDAALAAFRASLRRRTGVAVTAGYGPRFLHSTGQLHKGDGGNGHFIQLTSPPLQDLPIPDESGEPGSSLSFGVLKMAQALGDARALRDAGRDVMRFHLEGNVPDQIAQLAHS